MKIFLIFSLAIFNVVQSTQDIADKEVQFIGPFKKLLDFRYVYENNEQIKVTWKHMGQQEQMNPEEGELVDASLGTEDCYKTVIESITEDKALQYLPIDKENQKELLKCIKNTKKSNNQQIIFENVDDAKQLELYPYQNMTLMQNKVRLILKSFDLVSGITLDQSQVKGSGDTHFQIQGSSDILTQALKIFDESAAGNKFKVIQKMMVTSVILKKVWQLVLAVGGINLFKCPDHDDNSDRTTSKQSASLFTEKLIDLDLVTKQIFKNLYEQQQKQKVEKIEQLRTDYNNGYDTEHYKPLNEINIEVENLTNQQTIIRDSYDFPDPLSYLNNIKTKFDHVSRQCEPTMFKQFPVILPKVNVDMFGFSKDQFRLIVDIKRGFQEQRQDEKQFFRPETDMLLTIQTIIRGYKLDDQEVKQKFLDNLNKNIDVLKTNMYLGSIFSSQNAETLQIDEKMIESIKSDQDINKIKSEFRTHRYETWNSIYDAVDPALLIKYLVDPNFLIDSILEKLKIGSNWLPQTEYLSHIMIARLKALYQLNYSRLLNHLYRQLKFSPLVVPDSYDYYKLFESNQNAYQNIQYNEATKSYFKRPEGKISEIIVKDKVFKPVKEGSDLKPEDQDRGEVLAEEVTYKNASDITVKLSQNPFNRTASKDHIVYQSFMFFFDDFLKQFVSRDSSLVQCLLPQGQMKRGSQCPIFFKDLMKFASKNPKVQMDFTSVYGLFISFYESDPNEIKNTIQNLLDQMLIFSRFQYNKLLFEKEDFIDDLIRKKVYDMYPSEMRIIEDDKRHFFEDLYFEMTIYQIGRVVPEFQNYFPNYFFYKYSDKQKVQDLIDKINQDKVTVPDPQESDENPEIPRERKLPEESVHNTLI